MTSEPFRLGTWRVDPGLCEIANGERTLHVEPRAMAVLCHLAAHAGKTVSRDELLDAVWKTRHVVEDVLTRCISQLRQSLGDDAKEARYIQTVPKVGYRLLVAPEPLAAEPPAQIETPSLIPWWRWLAVAAAAALAIVAVVYLFVYDRPTTTGTNTPFVAILPFVVVGEGDDAGAFADGMTDDVIQLLATVPDLRVMSRTSSFHFKGRDANLRATASELNVQYVLEGSVQRVADRIRIKAQLIDARNDLHLWSQEYDRALVDVFEVQREIAAAVARRLNVSIDERLLARGAATNNMAAYQLYVAGKMASEKYAADSARDSIAMLEAAVQLDPEFASAWSALALARWIAPASSNMAAQEIAKSDELARAAARRAIELDDSFAGAQFVLADSARVAYAYSDAEVRYRAALAATPNDPSLHVGYGNLLSDAGRIRDSLTHRQLAHTLNPLSPVTAFFLARGSLLAGDVVAARGHAARSRELGFRNPVLDHMQAYLHVRERNWQAARAIWSQTEDPVERHAMEEVLAALETSATHDAALAAIERLPPWNVLPFRGRLYAALLLGEREVAWRAAQEGIEMKLEPTDIWWLPEAAPLRADARFAQLSERLGLLRYWNSYGWPDACSDSRTRLQCGAGPGR